MNNIKRLAASMTGAVAIAALVGTSAFAESRHSDATNDHHEQRSERSSRDHSSSHSDVRRGGDSSHSQNNTYRNNDRGRTQNDTYRNNDRSRTYADTYRNNDRSRTYADTYRNETRSRSNDASRFNGAIQSDSYRNRGSFDRGRTGYNGSQNFSSRNSRPAYDSRGRRNYSIGGRINRFAHESGGYRIWIDGGRYPVWIPEARIGLFPRLRVGLSLNFGGYYDPLGYVEAYDYYDGAGYGYESTYSSGLLRGVVETVDYRRGTLVLRDDTSGNFVTALIRDRRLESLRPGDYAEISGDWTRNGVFEALRLENVDGGRY